MEAVRLGESSLGSDAERRILSREVAIGEDERVDKS